MDAILNNADKFEKLKQNSNTLITEIIKKVNNHIKIANTSNKHFTTVTGDYTPGYCYGTIKTHKAGNPQRPVIAQVTTPTYQTAKKLNELLTPYVPTGRSVASATEFIDLLRTAPPCQDIASLDVESLFTNVPVDTTISIILDRVYRSEIPPLDIPEHTLKAMLEVCTKEAPFLSHRGELFRQKDGVAMGSPLGVLFANMYMCHIEHITFQNSPPPGIYSRYIDDIFITKNKNEDTTNLITALENNSVLKFTSENSDNGRLPFLDIDITKQANNKFETKVYTKATNVGRCLNAKGECPEAYKRSVVAAYVNRALTHCSTWQDTDKELNRVKQLLTNNGYSDHLIETTINEKLNNYTNKDKKQISQPKDKIIIYYQNFYHDKYKEECDLIKNIIKRNVKPTDQNSEIALRIYCKPSLTRSLIMRNSTAPRVARELSTNVIYNYKCQQDHCDGTQSYIGRTSTTLRRRLQAHKNSGAIFEHFINVHDKIPKLQTLIDNTVIEHSESRFRKLQIAEAVFIHTKHPSINVQKSVDFILPSARRHRITQNISPENTNPNNQTQEVPTAHQYNTRSRNDH